MPFPHSSNLPPRHSMRSSLKSFLKTIFGRLKPAIIETLPPSPKLLIFDFDGTIADTFEAGYEIFNKLADELGYRQVNREELQQLRAMSTLEALRYTNIPLRRMGKVAQRGCQELVSRIDGILPFPTAAQTLHELHRHGYRLCIITSNTRENVARFLRNHDLEIFEFVWSSAMVLGKTREICNVLRHQELQSGEVILIGDETRDIEAAQSAGIPVIAISSGYATRAALEKARPTALVDTFSELLPLLAPRAPSATLSAG